MQIGVLADTHGYLDPRAIAALRGVEHILHAGDIGNIAIITALEELASVTAIHGNVDYGTPLARQFPAAQSLMFNDTRIYMTHIGDKPERLINALPEPHPDVYIFGHSHIALLETHNNVVFLNPGAAGRPRFGGGLSVALLTITSGSATAQIVPL
ncbi:MAG: metallophosphoesterase [Chloroflexi bacterium AL-W]|nr:metallophosphoesterase [Chloroflexi bacterium AL-N1]NOK71236.1 metallophosphoesterase [Chloroflexi bacterium AL-N10]NOK76525.1 metallophosphoesterase [Chloroflexi bacterium AL-N5]NOK83643.1 metallophosphoesterase [Chloroflexi bacterium AL-W]NOK92236.1 metallophosphoesterase [Chloroflexi bacterium AL-N15]